MSSAAENYKGVWGHRVGFGDKAALLLIDFVQAYTLEESPMFGAGVVAAVAHSAEILRAARDAGMMVIHTTITHQSHTLADAGAWYRKSPILELFKHAPYNEFCGGLEPLPGEIVLHKQYASSFFGTSLASTLTASKVDTLIVLGCSTSGCVRATAVDGVQHGLNVIVVREGVGDRHPDPHEANLFDIDSKYGDVVSKRAALEFIRAHRAA
ncbi:isochorismatase family protein 14 [Achromobacter xylosoxidans A8]|uniref:Isochorismatase family protein 14 n=1 Tax=Achromobacter xylosoxidans (strain A8) TaxID=762376 RepID=E3HKH0_ACHXA|nr:isochorismatase family protein [Achromobacter xylosoxidans]ADP19258.1 isochorismatase family protein 14 [Achromobacter xylosoxidans A8]